MGFNRPSFRTGQNTLAAAGTAEQCTAATVVQGIRVVIRSRSTNTGLLYIGYSKADAELNNFSIIPAGSIALLVDSVGDVWVDAAETGDIVEWIYEVPTE